jgi:RNA polymerase sigma-70 factor (ECF subfamily)
MGRGRTRRLSRASLRVPIVLRYYADLSERDIALAIGRRQGTVKSRLHEARRRLSDDPAIRALGESDPGSLREAGQ